MYISYVGSSHDGGDHRLVLISNKDTVAVRNTIDICYAVSTRYITEIMRLWRMLEMKQSKKSIFRPSLVCFVCWVFDLHHGPFYLFFSTKVRCEDVLLSLSCPGSSIVEHGVERISRVAILFKHSVAILGPFMNKHIPWYYVFVKTI